ncbi:3139_t:CDS:1, partial [Acaulospora colombiana]
MGEIKSDLINFSDTLTILSSNVEQLKVKIKTSGVGARVSNPLNEVFKARKIKHSDLKQPDGGSDNSRGENGQIIKKIYLNSIEVACKKIQSIEQNETAASQKIQTELVILDLLGKCDYIITFYGLSEIENEETVMVFAWPKYGNLRSFYENYVLDWHLKLTFIRDIFRGLLFIHNNDILHHDVRCENIL